MIRRNRIVVVAIGLLTAVSGVALWTANAAGVQTNPAGQSRLLQQDPPPYAPVYPLNPGQEDKTGAAYPDKPAGKKTPDVEPAALVAKTTRQMGSLVTDGVGHTLYRFDKDQAKPAPQSNCTGACEQTWPPLLTSADRPMVIDGVDPAMVGTTTRPDGSQQVTIGNWPVYTYSGDPGPGKWKGQGVGGTWFVVAPDGSRNVSCLPPGVTPPADKPAPPKQDSGTGNGNYN